MRPKGSADVTRLAGVCEARGWFRAPRDLARARERAPEHPLRFPSAARAGTTCGEIERVSGPVRSPSPAQLGEHRAGSEGSGMRCPSRARGGPGRKRMAGSGWPGCRGGPGRVRGGGRRGSGTPWVPSGPGGPPPQDLLACCQEAGYMWSPSVIPVGLPPELGPRSACPGLRPRSCVAVTETTALPGLFLRDRWRAVSATGS